VKIYAPNFLRLFSSVLLINVLFLSEITLRIRNWHNAKLSVRILQLHIVICCDVTFQTIFSSNLLKKTASLLRKIDTQAHYVHGWATKRKTCSGRPKTAQTAENVK